MQPATNATEESKRFAIDTVRRSFEFAQDFTVRVYGDAPRPLRGDALLTLLRANMWREYMLGVQGPAKLMTLIGTKRTDLTHLLGTQIVDEMRHSSVFSQRVADLGGNGDLLSYDPTPQDWQLVEATLGFDNPAELVTSLNCAGEVVLQQTFVRITERKLGSASAIVDSETADIIIRECLMDDEGDAQLPIVDEVTAEEMRLNIIPDEGRHVKFGRLVLQEFATTPQIQERCREVQQLKFEALDAAHGRTMEEAKQLQVGVR